MANTLLQGLQQAGTIENTKGGEYYATTYDSNLDFFSEVGRFDDEEKVEAVFSAAYSEDRETSLANLLYTLDIRGGKGERKIFKAAFRWLCHRHPSDAVEIMHRIPEYGRWDYVLEAAGTPVWYEAVNMISRQLFLDCSSDNPSLLAKWLPSVKTHGKRNPLAKRLAEELKMSEKEYRKLLSELRSRINIVEKQMSEGRFDEIDFEKVPSKAMMKYRRAWRERAGDSYRDYLDSVQAGEKKVNTNGLFCYEIVKRAGFRVYMPECSDEDARLADLMWKNQKDFLEGNRTNVLVMADTSGSMTWPDMLPMANSVGLAIYTAERNHGFFHNYFMTFSDRPCLQKVSGETITEKLANIKSIIADTNIDAAFEMLLNTAVDNSIPQEDMPSHIIIISDMEFDRGVMSRRGTNLSGWKKTFKDAGYTLPAVIFWNVAGHIGGTPATKNDRDVCMISGFSTSVLSHILDIENYSPVTTMMEILEPYRKVLGFSKEDKSSD